MAELIDIVSYIISKYPKNLRDELSNARLTKIVYLSDWHSALKTGSQMSKIKWYFDNHGPYVNDIINLAKTHGDFLSVEETINAYGSKKRKISLKKKYEPELSKQEKNSIDRIIEITKTQYWNEFIQLVYGTHPIASSERYTFLDLEQKAKEHNAVTKG
jgi:hypothetical protein